MRYLEKIIFLFNCFINFLLREKMAVEGKDSVPVGVVVWPALLPSDGVVAVVGDDSIVAGVVPVPAPPPLDGVVAVVGKDAVLVGVVPMVGLVPDGVVAV